MATEGDNRESVNTRLTKYDLAPAKVKEGNNFSVLAGDTRESKAKHYATAEKNVSLQYVDITNNLNCKHKAGGRTTSIIGCCSSFD